MNRILNTVILLALMLISAYGNNTKSDKYLLKSGETQLTQNQPPVSLYGKIRDESNNLLRGASVIIPGTEKGVNANESGEYFFDHLQAGKLNVQASIMGFKTQTIVITVKPGPNELNFILVEDIIHLDPVSVIAQKRDQQILDVPAAISVVGADFIEKANITELGQLSSYTPGLFINEQGANRPSFIIRGLTSEEVSPSAQPRVSVYYNNVPINRANGASVELFDMDRVEVLKGPQNSLFGRGAQIGAIHFISKSPENNTNGYISAGLGDYHQKEFRGAVNVPILENKLFVRAAGVYDFRNGFVKNTFGGTLNGKNTLAGRLSLRFIPSKNQKLDLVLNYQKDNTPGIAFMSKQFPNTSGESNIFTYRASLEQGKNLRTGKELFDAAITYKYIINEHTYWSSISSYRNSASSARWDGDGTAAPAIDMWEDAGARQFYEEIRYNFSVKSRLIGFAGASYWHEKANDTYWFSPNEQSMANLFLDPSFLILPDGQPLLLPALPNNPALGPLAGMPLPESHQENNSSFATNKAAEAFVNITYQLTTKLFFTGGLRTAYESFKLSNEAALTGGSPSTLGMLTGNYPNLFFKPDPVQSINNNSLSVNWQGGLQYKINENSNVFANYSNGRRSKVLQYTSTGTPEILKAERVDNIDAGFKISIMRKVYVDVVGFYQKYNNFQTRAWIADLATGEFNYKSIDGGMATSYGVEASFKASLLKGLNIFGNYTYLHATFDDKNSDGSKQEYAGNTFRLSPKHNFALGINIYADLTSNIQLFVDPSFSYRTHFYFEDANTKGLDQSAYGLLNINLGIELGNPKITLSIFGTNILDEHFVTSAGNTGSLFGVPTFVPGPPGMTGAKLTWRF
jgi:iron complex outermembrane recepter protein